MRTLRSLGLRWMLKAALGVGMGVGWVAADVQVAEAVGTKTFELDTGEKLAGGELKGAAITSTGDIAPGWASDSTALVKGTAVWSSLTLADGSVLLGVGPEGRVLKIDLAGKETVVAETGTLAVTSIVAGPGGKIYAATLPEGEIFVVDPTASVGVNPSAPAPAKPKAWAKLASDHVWALAFDPKRGLLFAATGPDGKIYRVDAAGASQVFYSSDDTQVVSLAIAPSGTLYAGTSSKGLLLAIDAAGKADVVQDFAGQEVKAIAFAPHGTTPAAGRAAIEAASGETLFCIVNEYTAPADPPRHSGPPTRAPSATGEPPRPIRSKGEVWKISSLDAAGRGGKPERLLRDDTTHFFSLAAEPTPREGAAVVYVGTGNDARVIAIDGEHGTSIVARADSRQIGAIGLGAHVWFAASDAGSFHRVKSIGGVDSTWTSKPLDAGLKAAFGKLTWQTNVPAAAAAIELQTRSGNTATPDPSWSGWSAPLLTPGKVTSPAARFIQLRARWKGTPAAATASIRGVSLAYAPDNLRGIVTEVSVPTQKTPTSGAITSGSEVASHPGSQRIAWKTDNPDGDLLRFRLWYRREDSTVWRPIVREDEPITGSEFTWTTESLPDGLYRVRVEASDEYANPIGRALKHAAESAPFLIDNTAPVIRSIALTNGRLQAEVVDAIGPIVRLEVQLDGRGPWRSITSTDGILDEAIETVDTQLGITGSHLVALRAHDAAGNATVREIEGK